MPSAYVELIANSTYPSIVHHSLSGRDFSASRQRNAYSSVRCARSVCPSVCGWYADEKTVRLPNSFHSSRQKSAVKRGSRSCTTLSGKPNYLTTASKNIAATASADSSPAPRLHAVRRVNLVRRSTQVKMALNLPPHNGSPVMKSIDHEPNLRAGTGNGSNKPGEA